MKMILGVLALLTARSGLTAGYWRPVSVAASG
jgi:hypothetical protein